MAVVSPDLAKERGTAIFNAEQLTYFLYDGADKTNRKRHLQNLVSREMAKYKLSPFMSLSREQQYEQALEIFARAAQLMESLGLKDPTEISYFREAALPQTATPYSLHHSMFIPTLEQQGSPEQQKKWLPLAESYRIIGTYAQTEMGHGTYLRGLETTATYDPTAKEFVINSPTVTSTKYWPGGLGKTANCCVLMAQLIIQGQSKGIHSFLVQIRDLDTHEPLPGVTVGDIGSKFGFQSNDNGFLRFSNVRIPRENMLMKFAKVMEDGTYVRPTNDRLVYGTMTLVRSVIVNVAARALSMAVTIAVRYSSVRRQSEIESGAGEVQVIDFQTQQMKLFPLLAAGYALTIAARNVRTFYLRVSALLNKGALEELPQLHALSSSLKALSSWEATQGIEQCRLACGGHGYSHASGIPKIYTNSVTTVTYEGENTVLMLQVARYLIKCASDLRKGQKLPSFMCYLQSRTGGTSKLDPSMKLEDLLTAYEHRAARMVLSVAEKLALEKGRGLSDGTAWNANSVQLVDAAKAHAKMYVVKSFVETVPTFSGSLRQVMESLCRLYAATGIHHSLGDFMQDGFINSEQASLVQSSVLNLLAEIRPNAVTLVDAFDFPDAVLESALGRWDGQVYDALYEYAQNSKLNEKQVLDAYHKYQRPFMESHWNSKPGVNSHL